MVRQQVAGRTTWALGQACSPSHCSALILSGLCHPLTHLRDFTNTFLLLAIEGSACSASITTPLCSSSAYLLHHSFSSRFK